MILVVHDAMRPLEFDLEATYEDPDTGESWRIEHIASGAELTWTHTRTVAFVMNATGMRRFRTVDAYRLASWRVFRRR